MKISGIYCIENIINHKKYIGRSKNIKRRRNEHFRDLRNNEDSQYLQKSWNKYGENNFIFYIIEECQIDSLLDKEKYYIKKLNSKSPNGYNLTDGGDGILNPSLELREKLSKRFRGKKSAWFGRHHTEETKRKISLANKGNKTMLGKHHSDKSKNKMSKKRIGLYNRENNPRFGKKLSNASSSYYGVYAHIYYDKYFYWDVKIGVDGKIHNIGLYKDEISAAKAYDNFICENNLLNPLNFPM